MKRSRRCEEIVVLLVLEVAAALTGYRQLYVLTAVGLNLLVVTANSADAQGVGLLDIVAKSARRNI